MKLTQLTLSNFQSFGARPTTIAFEDMTFLIGPNGAGKTAVLQSLARLFASDPSLRRLRQTDFHVNRAGPSGAVAPIDLWIEAQFEFPELNDSSTLHPTIPGHFAHLQLESADQVPRVRLRLEAHLDDDDAIDEQLYYVIQVDEHGAPVRKVPATRADRAQIHVHYLPARRDPSEHVSYAANSLLGRALRAVNWQAEKEQIADLTSAISVALEDNPAIERIDTELASYWSALHKSSWYADPGISFARSEIDNLLKHLTIGFAPGPDGAVSDFSLLSDGQKSLLYLSLVLAVQRIGQQVLENETDAFNIERLKPAVFTLVAMEEPENSLSPHYLGRIIQALTRFSQSADAQAIVATHAPSLLKRAPPEKIRYLRLSAERTTTVNRIVLPDSTEEAYKFVREAVQAFPELYFSRLVILGEGDSEEVVLPRLLEATGLGSDDTSVSVVPLGGRHVNHFWRLLHALEIPYVTLLDLDLGRYQGGWGRIKYALGQLLKFPPSGSALAPWDFDGLPPWDDPISPLDTEDGELWLSFLEKMGVFFSGPLDLDFLMLQTFPKEYGTQDGALSAPDAAAIAAVLGKSHADPQVYTNPQLEYFEEYHRVFKLGSKPAAHLGALAVLDNSTLDLYMPSVFDRLLKQMREKIQVSPE